MPPDASPAIPVIGASLAPPQIYILLAITLTTFAWLLKPEAFGQLSGRQLWPAAFLVLYQSGHVVSYVAIERIAPEANTLAHGFALAGYLLTAVWLFRTRWIEARDQPPNSPDGDFAGIQDPGGDAGTRGGAVADPGGTAGLARQRDA